MDKDVKRELSAYWQRFQMTPEQERRVDNDVFDSFVQCYLADEEEIEQLKARLQAIERAARDVLNDPLIRYKTHSPTLDALQAALNGDGKGEG